jgi:hypothetical protein
MSFNGIARVALDLVTLLLNAFQFLLTSIRIKSSLYLEYKVLKDLSCSLPPPAKLPCSLLPDISELHRPSLLQYAKQALISDINPACPFFEGLLSGIRMV